MEDQVITSVLATDPIQIKGEDPFANLQPPSGAGTELQAEELQELMSPETEVEAHGTESLPSAVEELAAAEAVPEPEPVAAEEVVTQAPESKEHSAPIDVMAMAPVEADEPAVQLMATEPEQQVEVLAPEDILPELSSAPVVMDLMDQISAEEVQPEEQAPLPEEMTEPQAEVADLTSQSAVMPTMDSEPMVSDEEREMDPYRGLAEPYGDETEVSELEATTTEVVVEPEQTMEAEELDPYADLAEPQAEEAAMQVFAPPARQPSAVEVVDEPVTAEEQPEPEPEEAPVEESEAVQEEPIMMTLLEASEPTQEPTVEVQPVSTIHEEANQVTTAPKAQTEVSDELPPLPPKEELTVRKIKSFKRKGYTAAHFAAQGIRSSTLVEAGFTLTELAQASLSAPYFDSMSLQELKEAGFSAAQLRKAHVGSKRELVAAGYSETQVRDAGYRPASTSKTLVVGLDGSGKTALLCTLTKEPRSDQPTVGYNVQSLTLDDVAFTCYDLAGQEGLRVMWTHYITSDVRSVIFCIDSSDSSRFQEARDTLAAFFNNRALDKVSVLVLATKADLAGAYPIDHIKTKLWVGDTLQNHHWKIAAVTTDDREGMVEAMSFLAQLSPKAKAQYESDEAEDDAKKQKCSIM